MPSSKFGNGSANGIIFFWQCKWSSLSCYVKKHWDLHGWLKNQRRSPDQCWPGLLIITTIIIVLQNLKKKSHINFIRREFLYKNKLISSHYCYYTYCKFSPLFYPLRTPHKSIHFGICHFPYFYCWSIHDDLLPPSLIIKTRWNTHDSCWPNQKGVTVISILIHNTYIDKMLLQK